ncbi:glycosyltransferase family 4 protein [Flavicella sediminum]|uniref:glycosyltransferase family 4 protein n=1 Tax=Flavicella sediminum TaxID=2585141 RepID=UPI001122F794|nr:glycosyltransferase family 4 protein [Flavicella sediminum]
MKPKKPILVHTHFHRRRTGLTRSVENVFPFFLDEFDAYIYGYGVEGRKISFSQVLKLVLSRTYFVMHCHRNNELMRALLFRLLGGEFKLIATRHAESKPSGLTNFLLKKSDVVIALTNAMQEKLAYPSEVVGHGVVIDTFKPNKEEHRKEIKQKYSLTCAGRVRKSKGQKVLLETISPILKKHSDWALVIVGKVDKPEFLTELKAIVAQNQIENQVYFVKETPDIISYYQSTHSVIVPSFTEGFSLVCAEAMACGCNVIATRNVGVHSDIIQEKKNGYLFDINDTNELSGLLENLCEGTLPHLGLAAEQSIAKHWSAQIEANNLMAIYKR